MASIINATTTAGVSVQGDNSGSLQLATNNGTTALTITTGQNVGIGVTATTQKLWVNGNTCVPDDSVFGFHTNPSAGAISNYYSGSDGSNYLRMFTGGSERMRIDSSGKIGMGVTVPNCLLDIASTASSSSYQTLNITNSSATSTTKANNRLVRISSNANGADSSIQFTDNVSNNYYFGGYNGVAYASSNNNQGVKLSAGATSWAADSDERLKNIKEPITNAISNLSTLRTVYGNYKDDKDDVSRLFLIAQDVQKVYPEVVDVYQDEQQTLGLRYSDLIPVLVASIKELKAELDATKAEVQALKGTL